jgi:hypothetical protein
MEGMVKLWKTLLLEEEIMGIDLTITMSRAEIALPQYVASFTAHVQVSPKHLNTQHRNAET